jgi:predicted dehydrogenase
MGHIHAQCWQVLPEAEVVAVVDILPDRADKLARLLVCEAYLDFREAIARPDVDVVSVCIPTNLHAEATIPAAELGLHVLCEKPIALTLEDADRMISITTQNQVKLGLGFMRRHTPVLVELKTRLASGEFGRPVMYSASDVRELRPKREMHDANANGGPVIDMAVHLIDLWNYIFDSRPVSVSAQGLRLATDRSEIHNITDIAIDTASIQVHYASGDIGTFVVCWGLPPKVNPSAQPDQIYSPRGVIEISYGQNLQEMRVMQEGGFWHTQSISHHNMYQTQIQCFSDWILKDEPFPSRGEDGKLGLEVALAALESINTGKTVNL